MMPDMSQQGREGSSDWTPDTTAPIVYLNGVSKSYGRIHALSNITLGLSGGVTRSVER